MIARTARVAALLLAALSCRPSATPLVMLLSDTEIVLTRTFGAPRESAFAALTRPDQIARWMRSTGMTLVDCDVDLRAGGALRHVFARAGGRRLEVRGTFRVVEAPRRTVYLESYDELERYLNREAGGD